MKLWMGTVLLMAALGARADDGGGRDVSVAVFSTRAVHALMMTPVGQGAWTARCATCRHEPMAKAWRSDDGPEVFAGGTLRVRDEVSGAERVAAGLWHVKRVGTDWDVVLTLPSERYVSMVVGAETDAKEPVESLKAMAVVVRTYALNGSHYTARPGHLSAELCDSTQCQAMRWGGVGAAVEAAVRETAGQTLWSGSRRAEVYFSGSCGGQTEDAGVVWPGLRGVSYLKGHADPYCVRRDGGAKWHAEVSLAELAGVAKVEGWKLPVRVSGVKVAERSASGRALRVVFSGNGESDAVAASALRFGVGRALGYGRVRSDAYEVSVRGEAVVFDGRGHGHGVGLCQTGAMEMASEGKQAVDILGFYFPGTRVGVTAKEAPAGAKIDLQSVWAEAQRRFLGAKVAMPKVMFAPTVEMFRQMSGEPGWMLASTRGDEIVVQPASIVGAGMRALLLHEMLHVLVESEAGPTTPLWLREGVVEVLAGENGGGTMSSSEMERALRGAASRETNEKAHRAAAWRVKGLVGRYGMGVIRGWLRTGTPAGV